MTSIGIVVGYTALRIASLGGLAAGLSCKRTSGRFSGSRRTAASRPDIQDFTIFHNIPQYLSLAFDLWSASFRINSLDPSSDIKTVVDPEQKTFGISEGDAWCKNAPI